MILYHVIFILTRNYLYDKMCITNIRAIAQLGRAPRLHARQCFSEESIEELMSYSMLFRNKRREQQPDKRFGPIQAPI